MKKRMVNGMKRCCLLLVFFLFRQDAFSQDHTEMTLKDIRSRYQEINANRKAYRKVVTTSDKQSSEGGEVNGYFLKDSIRLIEEIVYREGGKYRAAVYYDKAVPFFILTENYTYNVPFYVTSFDSKLTKVTADRAYFYHGKMIRWINEQQQILSARNKAYVEKENSALTDAQQLYKLILAEDTDKKTPPPAR